VQGEKVRTATVSANAKFMALGAEGGSVSVFDPLPMKPIRFYPLKAHDKAATGVAFSPDEKVFATCGLDGPVKLWDAERTAKYCGMEERPGSFPPMLLFAGHAGGTHAIAFSADGKQIASCGADGTAKVWDASSGKLLAILSGHRGAVLGIAFHPDGKQVVTTGSDKTVKLWKVAPAGKPSLTISGFPGPVHAVAVSPDGSQFATASGVDDKSGQVKVWDLSSGKEVANLEGHSDTATLVTFHPKEPRLASAGRDATIRVWNLVEKAELYRDKLREPVAAIAFSGDGRVLTTASAEIAKNWLGTPPLPKP
jgi:WD40 repeat protein